MNTIKNVTEAAMNGNTKVVEKLIKEDNSLLNIHSSDGWTPLHLAAYFGHEETTNMLLMLGADIHIRAKNNNENMPLHAAVANNQAALVSLLLENGADINAKQSGGWTSLHEAALLGNAQIVSLLLEKGADTNVTKDDGKTALHIAKEKGYEEVIQMIEKCVEGV
ncbi:ankyrin repeat domain-containing protein [Bacillus manliponensis]|nr:ankyrin repeat domain-containing protein [Bacillus manliponensis]